MATKNTTKTTEQATDTAVAKVQRSASERFTSTVMKLYGQATGGQEQQLTEQMKRLASNYFIGIDRMLQAAELKRLAKNANNKDHKYDQLIPYEWNNVDLPHLALQVVDNARMGLDILLPNQVHAIPYEDKKRKLYTVNLMPGYNGIILKALKYALVTPKSVTIELVYSTDVFTPIKKSATNNVEGYHFEITNAFDRGQVVGGFGYIEYEDATNNKLIIMSRKDIEKRKPEYASGEFWGGTIRKWENGKQVSVETDGWYEEMAIKTIKREVYSAKHMPLDSAKVDDAYYNQMVREAEYARLVAQDEIEENQLRDAIDITPPEEESAPPPMMRAPEPKPAAVIEPEPESEQMAMDDLENMPSLPFSME